MRSFSTLHLSTRSTLAVIFGRGDFAAMHQLAPVSASVWLFSLILTVLFLAANMLIALIVDHYAEVDQGGGRQASQSIIEQFWVMMGDWWWKSTYIYRRIHMFIYDRSSPLVQKFMHVFDPNEPRRLPVPY